jgi:hypothetical protein
MIRFRTGSAGQSAGCPREIDVVASILDRHATRIDDGLLAAHIESCEICRDVAVLTRLMSTDHDHAHREVRVPAAGQVWWRAAIRARLEAVHAAARPLTWSHGIAAACTLGLVVAIGGLVWPVVREAAGRILALAVDVAPLGAAAAALVTTSLHGSAALTLVAAACVLLAPVALYLALADE